MGSCLRASQRLAKSWAAIAHVIDLDQISTSHIPRTARHAFRQPRVEPRLLLIQKER